jgi:hypothetical protein
LPKKRGLTNKEKSLPRKRCLAKEEKGFAKRERFN